MPVLEEPMVLRWCWTTKQTGRTTNPERKSPQTGWRLSRDLKDEDLLARWEGGKDVPGRDWYTVWGTLQEVSVTMVWASVQRGLEEKPSKVDYGHFLNFCKRTENRKERIQADDGQFIIHFPMAWISFCLSLGRVTSWDKGENGNLKKKILSFFFFLYLIPHC